MSDEKKMSNKQFKQLIEEKVLDEQLEPLVYDSAVKTTIIYDITLLLIRDLRDKLALIFSILQCDGKNFLSQREEDEIRDLLKRVNGLLKIALKEDVGGSDGGNEADPVQYRHGASNT